jgi:hypothetical protein
MPQKTFSSDIESTFYSCMHIRNVKKYTFLNLMPMILWRNRPMRELLKFRNLKERDCATVAERCRILPPLPSPRFASLRVLLGDAISIGPRNNNEGSRNLS